RIDTLRARVDEPRPPSIIARPRNIRFSAHRARQRINRGRTTRAKPFSLAQLVATGRLAAQKIPHGARLAAMCAIWAVGSIIGTAGVMRVPEPSRAVATATERSSEHMVEVLAEFNARLLAVEGRAEARVGEPKDPLMTVLERLRSSGSNDLGDTLF